MESNPAGIRIVGRVVRRLLPTTQTQNEGTSAKNIFPKLGSFSLHVPCQFGTQQWDICHYQLFGIATHGRPYHVCDSTLGTTLFGAHMERIGMDRQTEPEKQATKELYYMVWRRHCRAVPSRLSHSPSSPAGLSALSRRRAFKPPSRFVGRQIR